MKPAAFDYVVPRTVPETVEALGDTGRKAQVLAGGKSLILEMHLQRIRPDLVIDINRIPALDEMRVYDNSLRSARWYGIKPSSPPRPYRVRSVRSSRAPS